MDHVAGIPEWRAMQLAAGASVLHLLPNGRASCRVAAMAERQPGRRQLRTGLVAIANAVSRRPEGPDVLLPANTQPTPGGSVGLLRLEWRRTAGAARCPHPSTHSGCVSDGPLAVAGLGGADLRRALRGAGVAVLDPPVVTLWQQANAVSDGC